MENFQMYQKIRRNNIKFKHTTNNPNNCYYSLNGMNDFMEVHRAIGISLFGLVYVVYDMRPYISNILNFIYVFFFRKYFVFVCDLRLDCNKSKL